MGEIMYRFLESCSDETAKNWDKMVKPAIRRMGGWLRTLQQNYGDKDTYVEEDEWSSA